MKFLDWLLEVAKTALVIAIVTAALAAALFHALGINLLRR